MNPSIRRCLAWLSLGITLVAGGLGHGLAAETTPEPIAMWMNVGGKHRFAMTLEDNPTAREFAKLLPLSLEMPDLNANEKHARLPKSLPSRPELRGTIRAGDVMLYGDDTLVVFYKTFPSSYRYTRIGRLPKVEGLVEALGPGSPRIGFSMD